MKREKHGTPRDHVTTWFLCLSLVPLTFHVVARLIVVVL
jgi:hypothetical protein